MLPLVENEALIDLPKMASSGLPNWLQRAKKLKPKTIRWMAAVALPPKNRRIVDDIFCLTSKILRPLELQ